MKATYFEFTSYTFEPEKHACTFSYSIVFDNKKTLDFTEVIELTQPVDISGLPEDVLAQTLQGVHLMLGVSYFKLYAPAVVKHPYVLTIEQSEYWNSLYTVGLGEFYYQNNLDPHAFEGFSADSSAMISSQYVRRSDRALVGIGGGKDSIVGAELLKKMGYEITAFVKETQKQYDQVDRVIEVMGIDTLKIRRLLDPQIFEKHDDSYNGHVPISGVYAWLGLLSALLYDYKYVVVSNEYSSSFGNIEYKGIEINHQWSKSIYFEEAFQSYVHNFITPNITYFSVLRSIYEIRIVELFAQYPQYFNVFTSCNRTFSITNTLKNSLWCGECPKCVFGYMMLSAHIEPEQLVDIFGQHLYDREDLEPLFLDLLGLGDMKPFDCVGTFEESQVAFLMASEKYKNSYIIQKILTRLDRATFDKMKKNVFGFYHASCTPARFKMLPAQSIAIIGYGVEGKETHNYLKKYYPGYALGIIDQQDGPDYLDRQADYDIAIKTPGIPKEEITIPYTTATNIFFSHVKGEYRTIGITGTKGKSTTSSLIHALCVAAQKDTYLLGNIGQPLLSLFVQDKPLGRDAYLVLELSSYQLDDCEYSPDCAVVLNLYSDHMSYHGSIERYHEAKRAIVAHQYASDAFFCLNGSKACAWDTKAQHHIVEDCIVPKDIALLGDHNIANICVAKAVNDYFKCASDQQYREVVSNFKPLPHRLNNIGEFKGITFYDDALSTTPESTIAALEALEGVHTILLGGEDRGYDFERLVDVLIDKKVQNIVLFPETGKRIKPLLPSNVNVFETNSMEEAIQWVYTVTQSGGICLLSTASPSFSLWKDYKEKGTKFREFVARYGQ